MSLLRWWPTWPAHHLPRDRPLWEIVVVEGLDGRRIGVVAKVHHAVADGAATVALLLNASSADRRGHPPNPSEDPWHPEPIPTRPAAPAPWPHDHQVTRCEGPAPPGGQLGPGARASEARRRSLAAKPPSARSTRPEDGVQRVAHPGADLRHDDAGARGPQGRAPSAAGITLNDVYLAMCGGALRSYLLDQGSCPTARWWRASRCRPIRVSPALGEPRRQPVRLASAPTSPTPSSVSVTSSDVAAASKDVRSVLGNDLLEKRADVVPPQLYALSVRTVEPNPPREPHAAAGQPRALECARDHASSIRSDRPSTRGHLLGGSRSSRASASTSRPGAMSTRCTSRCSGCPTSVARSVVDCRRCPPRLSGRHASGGRVRRRRSKTATA